jgi:outer membrane immunogenic protein
VKNLLLAVSVIALTSSAALAADLAPAPVEPVAPVYVPYSWTGFYVGAQIGYTWGDSTFDGAGSPAGTPYLSTSVDPKGIFGGGYAGYNYQFDGGFVVGVEADINASDAKSDHNAFPAGPFGPGLSADSNLKWFGSARLRLGYAFDRFLPFVTGGVAFGKYDAETHLPGGGVPANLRDIDLNKAGWTIGAGLEYAFTDNIIGRVEYRYTDYGDKKRSGPFQFASQPVRIDLSTNDVRVGVAYKF